MNKKKVIIPNEKRLKKQFKRAMSKIVMKHPFFAMIILSQDTIYTQDVPTMGVDGKNIYVNLDFVSKLSPDETIGVLIHECFHLCWNHVTRRGQRIHTLWNYSCVSGTTQVTLANNSKRAIIDIRPGDYVKSPMGPNKVLGIAFNGFKPVGILNNTLECTSDHRILTNDGFQSALSISNRNKNIFTVSGTKTNSTRQPQKNESKTIRTPNRNKVQNDRRIFTPTRTKSRSICAETDELSSSNDCKRTTTRLYSRYIRWGRNLLNWFKPTQKWENIFTSFYSNNKYILLHAEIFPKTGILWDRENEQFWKQILEHSTVRLQSNRFSETNRTNINCQTSSMSLFNRIEQAKNATKEKRPSDSIYVKNCERNKTFELTKGFFQERKTNIQPVFDLITEQGVYIANDIVVHNCDYAINPIVKDEGFILPTPHLDEARFHKMTANEIYEILEKEEPDIDPQFIDLKDNNLSAADKKSIEHHAKTTLAKAVQIAGDAIPNAIKKELSEIFNPSAPWENVLREFMQTHLGDDDSSWRRPNRRYLHDDIYLPISEGFQLPHVEIMLDTSGSIYGCPNLVEKFTNEVNSIITDLVPEKVTVSCVDTSVRSFNEYDEGELPSYEIKGGGGTDFTSYFDKLLDEEPPACIIAFTDLYASGLPQPGYPIPILWCVYENTKPNMDNVSGKQVKIK